MQGRVSVFQRGSIHVDVAFSTVKDHIMRLIRENKWIIIIIAVVLVAAVAIFSGKDSNLGEDLPEGAEESAVEELNVASTNETAGEETAGDLQVESEESVVAEETSDELAEESSEEATAEELIEEEIVEFTEEDALNATYIRVLLSNDGEYLMEDVIITSSASYTVSAGGVETSYTAGQTVTASEVDATTFTITPDDASSKLQVTSITKSCGHPSYYGTITVTKVTDGYNVVNTVDLERYLYSVVSSEVPSAYASEAQKAQAICARTYALKKMTSGTYSSYGADIDDTTSSQVYNNVAETSTSIAAVNATEGLYMTYAGSLVNAYFFSTSGGTTCRNDDVWDDSHLSYLLDAYETYDGGTPSLTTDEAFRTFLDDTTADSIEKGSAYYRWSIKYTATQMNTIVCEGLAKLVEAGSTNVGFSKNVSSTADADAIAKLFGDIVGIQVTSRGASGLAKTINITFENGVVIVNDQLTIRTLLGDTSLTINKNDGTTATEFSALPSAYFYIDVALDGTFTIKGGGFGHGCGLSQNGANILAGKGWSYEEILQHYYTGVSIESTD